MNRLDFLNALNAAMERAEWLKEQGLFGFENFDLVEPASDDGLCCDPEGRLRPCEPVEYGESFDKGESEPTL